MTDIHSAHRHLHNATAPAQKDISADRGSLMRTLAHLWPYIWPGDRADLKRRVVFSMVILLVAKIVTLIVPFTYKWAVDA